MEIEKRHLELNEPIEIREENGSEYLEGYGIVFNQESQDLGGFREVILPEALIGADMNDVLATFNHDYGDILGRSSSGTLQLSVDERGVKYKIKLPKTRRGEDVKELVMRKDVRGASFGFTIFGGGEKWEERQDGTYLRTVSKFKRIYDIGPVVNPAYLQTTAAKRSLDSFKESLKTTYTDTQYRQRLLKLL